MKLIYNISVMKEKIIEQYIEKFAKDNSINNDEAYNMMILQSIDSIVDEYNYEYTEVDGAKDIGIDNIILKQDNALIEDLNNGIDFEKKNSTFEFTFVQIKNSTKLKENDLNKFFDGIKYFIKNEERVVNERILEYKEIWDDIFDRFTEISPKIKIRIIFATRANNKKFESEQIKIISRKFNSLINEDLFDNSSESIILAEDEIFNHFKRLVENNSEKQGITYSSIIKSVGSLDPEKEEFDSLIILATFEEIYNLIEGNINYLYLENVRHFIGGSKVNVGIKERIENKSESMDFWIFNNGLTLLSDEMEILEVKSQIVLTNPKIIDGLQTSYSIFQMLSNMSQDEFNLVKDRKVLIKVISTDDEDVKADVIKSNNDRNKVSAINFLSMDDEQKYIENELQKLGYFYDRIANLHKNNGIDTKKIIKPLDLAISYSILYLIWPSRARNSKTSLITNESNKNSIFKNAENSIQAYLNVYKLHELLNKKINTYTSKVRKYLLANSEENSTLIKKHKNHIMVFIINDLFGDSYDLKRLSKCNFDAKKFIEKVDNDFIEKNMSDLVEFYERSEIPSGDYEKFIKSTKCDELIRKEINLGKNK